jgi:hypothetical protein
MQKCRSVEAENPVGEAWRALFGSEVRLVWNGSLRTWRADSLSDAAILGQFLKEERYDWWRRHCGSLSETDYDAFLFWLGERGMGLETMAASGR